MNTMLKVAWGAMIATFFVAVMAFLFGGDATAERAGEVMAGIGTAAFFAWLFGLVPDDN